MTKKNTQLYLLGMTLSVLFLLPGTLMAIEQSAATPVPQMRPIPTAPVITFADSQSRNFPGTVRASSRVDLAFNVSGQIIEAHLSEGTKVKKGDILARLDQRDFQHSYDAAKANALRLKKEFDRVKRLKKKQVVSQAEYDSAKSAHDMAQAELEIRKKALEDTILRAPFDGVIAKRYVQNYAHIKAKANIVSFKDISTIEVVVQVPERFVAQTSQDKVQSILVSFDADKSARYPGTLKEYSLQSDPITRTYEAVVAVQPPKSLNIFPGMTATVTVKVSADEQYAATAMPMFVPIEAVFADGKGKSWCWVIPEDGGNPIKREVQLGVIHENGILVTSGLQPGELVAVAGLHSLRQEMKVRPSKANWEGLDG